MGGGGLLCPADSPDGRIYGLLCPSLSSSSRGEKKRKKKVFSPGGMLWPVLALSIPTPRKFTTSAFPTHRPTAERFSAVVRSGVGGGGGEPRKSGRRGKGTGSGTQGGSEIDTREREAGVFSLSEASASFPGGECLTRPDGRPPTSRNVAFGPAGFPFSAFTADTGDECTSTWQYVLTDEQR